MVCRYKIIPTSYPASHIISNFISLHATQIFREHTKTSNGVICKWLYSDIYLAFENACSNEADSVNRGWRSPRKTDARGPSKSKVGKQRNQS